MVRPAKITTPFPTVLETAKQLGVSKRDALVLSEMAERSVKSGVFDIPGVGRLVRVKRKARIGNNPRTGEPIKSPEKRNPRATLEVPGGARRLDRTFELITSCEYSFHDLSRVQLDSRQPPTPRFNMPFEVGLVLGWLQTKPTSTLRGFSLRP